MVCCIIHSDVASVSSVVRLRGKLMNKQLENVLKFIILLVILSFAINIFTLLTIKNVSDNIKELKQLRYYIAEFTGEVPDLPNLPY